MTIFDRPKNTLAKHLAYGIPSKPPTPVEGGHLYRIERGTPFYRAGRTVYAVPQFRSLNLYSPTSQNALLPTIAISPTRIAYPVKVK